MPIYSKSQKQFLFDAINAVSPGAITPVDLDNATFGVPKAITPKTADDPNTEITIRGRQGRGYIGVQTYRYKRLSLNDIFKNMVPQVTGPNAFGYLASVAKKTAFAQNLNGRYGLNLVPDDIPDQYIYLNVNNTVRVLPTCVQYTGTITFMSVLGKNNLEELVLNDILPVMVHPIDITLGKRCATILGYGVDFTEDPQVMTTIVNGSMSVGTNLTSGFSDNLVALMVSRGLPSFDYTGAKVTRRTTAQEPRANKRFDNVLVITNVTDPQVAGDWLLHYNN